MKTNNINPMKGGCGFSQKAYDAVISKCGVQNSIIELGCGNGGNLAKFEGWKKREGIDPQLNNIEFARNRGTDINFVHGSHENLTSYSSNEFCVGITLSVLNHIRDVIEPIKDLLYICKEVVFIEPYIAGENRQAILGEIKLWKVTWFHDYEEIITGMGLRHTIDPYPLYKTNCGPYYHLIHVTT